MQFKLSWPCSVGEKLFEGLRIYSDGGHLGCQLMIIFMDLKDLVQTCFICGLSLICFVLLEKLIKLRVTPF